MRSLGFRIALITLLLHFGVYAQDIQVLTKVTKDSVAIKWLPNDFQQLSAIAQGATIKRIESNATSGFESLDFSNAKSWTIESITQRLDQLNSDNSEDDRILTVIDPLLNGASAEQENFAFGAALIENISYPKFQFILGNILVDKSVKRSTHYVYRIEVKGMKPVFTHVQAGKLTPYSTIDLSLDLDRKKTVAIKWNYTDIIKESFAYDIEHSIDKQKEGTFLTQQPYLPFTSDSESREHAEYRHDDPEQGHFHFYRIHGRDAFGQRALISDWQKIYVPKRIEAIIQIDSVSTQGKKRDFFISAGFKTTSNHIDRMELLRASDRDGNYTTVFSTKDIGPSIVASVEGELETGDRYYYIATFIGQDDTVSSIPYYFFTLDQQPPTPPTALSVIVNDEGIANLSWTASIDSDVQGYRVFRGNQKREEFAEQTEILVTGTSFEDTLRLDNLTSEVYYYLVAVDDNYNQSLHSDTIMGLKPDTIPPVPCVLKAVDLDNSGLLVSWINSDSEDVASTMLLRNGTVITESFDGIYLDSSITAGNAYTYELVTKDQSGNQSSSNAIYKYYEPGFRPSMKCSGQANLNKHYVELNWELPNEELFSIEVYRSKNDGRLSFFKAIRDTSQSGCIDRNVRIGETYTYSIKYITEEGIHSIPTEVIVEY